MQEKKMDEKKVREAIEELKDDINIYEFMIRDNKGFTSLCVKLKAKIEKLKTAIEALEKQLPKEYEIKDRTPYCLSEIEGFEMDDSDDNYECPYCRSNFAHQREVVVAYNSHPVSKNENILEVE